MNRRTFFNLVVILMLLAAGSGCAGFRKAFSRDPGLARSRRPAASAEPRKQSGKSKSDDQLFEFVFRKSRKEQQSRRIRSELLSPQERAAMEQYHRRDGGNNDRDVQKFNRERRYENDKRDKIWVFGF